MLAYSCREKTIVTHSSTLAWKIPGTGEPGGLLSLVLHRVGHNWSDLAAAAAIHVGSCLTWIITVPLYLDFRPLILKIWVISFSSVAQSCPTLWDLMDCSKLGFPVHHHLPEPAQTYVHWVGDVIQPSHPLSSPSPAFNLSQNQGLFQLVNSHQVGKVLELQLQHQSFQWIFRTDFLWINWCDLFALQRTLRSLPKGPSSKVPFFGAELFL